MVGDEFYHDMHRWRRAEGGEREARDLLLSYNQDMNFSEAEQYLLRQRRLWVKLWLHNMARAMEALHHP